MADVDAILARGRYTDLKGRTWFKCVTLCAHGGGWWLASKGLTRRLEDWHLTHDQMRTLIVRDQHRETCPGLRRCQEHPVPHVVYWRLSRWFAVYDLPGGREETAYTLAEAIDAARHMTGGQK